MRQGTALYAKEEHWQAILQSPEFFLHGIDVANGNFEFLKLSRNTLSSAAFLDGRPPLAAIKETTIIPIENALSWSQVARVQKGTNRYIFHMSFCGSTLASRLLDQPGEAVVYKEPQILLELAELKAGDTDWFRDKKRWQALMTFVLMQHQKTWSIGEVVILKPSNWANSMLPQLIGDGGDSRAVFLSISPIDFLIAVFRGGGERVKFTYRVLQHLLTAFPEFTETVNRLENEISSAPDLFARLALVTHAIQSKAFIRASLDRSLLSVNFCDYQAMLTNPMTSITQFANTLDLSLSDESISESIEKHRAQHSKVTHRGFNAKNAMDVNNQVLATYRMPFERALMWAEAALDPAKFY